MDDRLIVDRWEGLVRSRWSRPVAPRQALCVYSRKGDPPYLLGTLLAPEWFLHVIEDLVLERRLTRLEQRQR
jgi:hypothetical protein